MTTEISSESLQNKPSYTVSVWSVVPGLLWGAVALGIMAAWFAVRGLEISTPLSIATGLLSGASFLLFLVALLKRWRAKRDPAALAAMDSQLRPFLTLAAFAAGGVLLFLAIWLCFSEQKRLDVFAEISSLVVMALVCDGFGMALRSTGTGFFSRQHFFQSLLGFRPQIAVVLMLLGAVLGVAGGYFAFRAGFREFGSRYPGGPEGLGMLFLGLAILGAGVWMQLMLDKPSSADAMRMLVLYVGSVTGMLIALATAARMLTWWDLFSQGMNSWLGENSWRFWLCAYVGLIGLALLFGSLMLAKVDIRVNAPMRRVLYGYNAFLAGLLLFAFLVVVNIIVYVRLPSNVQWTESLGIHSLAGKSKQILGSLSERVTIYVLMPRGSMSYMEVSDLLDNCQNETEKITVRELSPDLEDEEYRKLARDYTDLGERVSGPTGRGGRGLLVIYGDAPVGKTPPHVFVPDADLEGRDMQGQSRSFKGEPVLMQTIKKLAEQDRTKLKVYFTQGNGELWIDDDVDEGVGPTDRIVLAAGIGEIVSMLRKDNYEVQGLLWDAKTAGVQLPDSFVYAKKSPKDQNEVPADCNVLVIANPKRPFPKDVLQAIDRYMERPDAKLMVLSNASILRNGKFGEDGMIEFCKKYNVELTDDFIMRFSPSDRNLSRVRALGVPGSKNEVGQAFTKRGIEFILPRTVKPMKEGGSYQAQTFLQIPMPSPASNSIVWAETDTNPLRVTDPRNYIMGMVGRGQIKIGNEPLPVAAAVTDSQNKRRGIIIGNYTFAATDPEMKRPWASDNYDLFRSCVGWLAERPIVDIGISAKEMGMYRLPLMDEKNEKLTATKLAGPPMALLILSLAGIGAGIWIVRRK